MYFKFQNICTFSSHFFAARRQRYRKIKMSSDYHGTFKTGAIDYCFRVIKWSELSIFAFNLMLIRNIQNPTSSFKAINDQKIFWRNILLAKGVFSSRSFVLIRSTNKLVIVINARPIESLQIRFDKAKILIRLDQRFNKININFWKVCFIILFQLRTM